MSSYEPKLVCFACKFSWDYLSGGDTLPSQIKNCIPVACSGKIDTTHIVDAFKEGVDGVLILGCQEGDCHFQDGNFETKKKVYLLHKVLEDYGIEKERLQIEFSVDPDGSKMPQLVKKMSDNISKLGPVKKI